MIQHCSTDQIPRKIHAYVLLGLFASFDREMQVSIYIYPIYQTRMVWVLAIDKKSAKLKGANGHTVWVSLPILDQ